MLLGSFLKSAGGVDVRALIGLCGGCTRIHLRDSPEGDTYHYGVFPKRKRVLPIAVYDQRNAASGALAFVRLYQVDDIGVFRHLVQAQQQTPVATTLL